MGSDRHNVIDLTEEVERRRSGVQTVAPPAAAPEPTVETLRSRYVVLRVTRELAPDQLTESGFHTLRCHDRVADEYGTDDAEEIYSVTTSGHLMRQRLREILPVWFQD